MTLLKSFAGNHRLNPVFNFSYPTADLPYVIDEAKENNGDYGNDNQYFTITANMFRKTIWGGNVLRSAMEGP